MAWIIIGMSEGIIIMWLMAEILGAPAGYEDQSGFHEVKEAEANLSQGVSSSEIQTHGPDFPARTRRKLLMWGEKNSSEFYVTDDCNGCGICKDVAPGFFDCVEYAYSYSIVRQPQTRYEVGLLKHASDLCVLDAIRQTART